MHITLSISRFVQLHNFPSLLIQSSRDFNNDFSIQQSPSQGLSIMCCPDPSPQKGEPRCRRQHALSGGGSDIVLLVQVHEWYACRFSTPNPSKKTIDVSKSSHHDPCCLLRGIRGNTILVLPLNPAILALLPEKISCTVVNITHRREGGYGGLKEGEYPRFTLA
jgi:hypothetical protein